MYSIDFKKKKIIFFKSADRTILQGGSDMLSVSACILCMFGMKNLKFQRRYALDGGLIFCDRIPFSNSSLHFLNTRPVVILFLGLTQTGFYILHLPAPHTIIFFPFKNNKGVFGLVHMVQTPKITIWS